MARSKQKKVENRDSGEINDAAGKVTEKSATKPLSEQRKSRLKNNVTKCFTSAFQSKNASSLPNINRQFKDAFIEASRSEEELKYFLKCVRFAMELTCEKGTEKERRSNCIRVVAYVAVVLAKDGKLQLLEALVKFCQELHDVTVVAARTQICFLIGMLFNADLIMNERAFEARDSLPIDQSVIPSDLKNSLYQILLQRRLDSSAAVRVEVLKGVSMIQHDCLTETKGGQSRGPFITPLQVLRKHFRDESSDCQLVAVRTISLAAKPEIDLMVEMALGSASTKVRRAALSRLAKDVDLKALSIAQRMELLKLMMQSREPSIHCDALNEMLNEWLTGATDRESNLSDDDVIDTSEYCFASTKLLRFLEPFNDEKTSHDLLVVAFRRCRERLLLQNAEVHEFVKKFIENANDTMTHSHSYNNLLNRKLTTLEQANAIFVWRCMVDFCEQETTSDADWIECRYRLLPTLHTFCDFVTKFTTLKSLYDDGEAGAAFKQFALLQLLKLLSCFDMDDPVGKQSLRNLSEMILTNRQLDVSNEIVNTIVRHMYTYVWPNPQDNDDALSTICDLTSSMVHKSINPNATMLLVNETISLSGHLPNADTTIAHADNEVDEETLLRCIRIVSAVLKTNRYRVMTALLRGLLENLIEKGVVSMNSECRILALESMGIIAMYDERIAFEKVILIKDTLEVDDDLKPTSLNILCNMCLLHGYANVSKWFAGSAVDFCDPRNDLIKVFVEFINDKNDEISFTACECICKLLLNETNPDWKSVLAIVFLKTFDPLTDKNDRLKACLVTFIPTYAESDRSHQLLLIEAFNDIFDMLRTANREQLIPMKKLNAIGTCLVCATSKQSCTARREHECSVHPELCRKILDAIENDPDRNDDFLSVYCKMLSQLEVHEWDDCEELNALKERTDELIDMVRELEASGQDVRIMTAFSRSLSKRIETVEDMSSRKRSLTATSNSEELISLTEQLRLETPHPKGSLANQQKLRFEEIDSELKTSTVPAPNRKPLNTTTSSTVRRPPRKPKARQQDLKKVLMEQNTDMAGIAATLTASSVRNVMITPSSSRRLRPVLQRAVKTPAASAFYKDIDSVIDEEAEA